MTRTNTWYITIFTATLILAAILRLVDLGQRPFHGDEANQAVRTGILLEEGIYEYDPNEHHGPTLYYLALVPLRLMGINTLAQASEADLRLLPVFFGLIAIVLLLPLRRTLGWPAILAAAILTAVSPAMTYYSRYFIQETLLLAFTLGAIVCGWIWVERRTCVWAFLTGAMLGAMFATKETCVIIFASMGAASLLSWLGQWRALGSRPALPQVKHVLCCIAGAFAISFLFYTSFLTYPKGFLNAFLAFSHYVERAQGEGSAGLHDKPWYYYMSLLGYTSRSLGPRWTEGFILLLAVAGLAAAIFQKPPSGVSIAFFHFILAYALSLAVLYSFIPYKTPWNLLPFYHGFILLAGIGAAAFVLLFRSKLWRAATIALFLVGTAHLGWQSWLANGAYAADVSNPYVYAHTSTNLVRLAERVNELAVHTPDGNKVHINVIKPDADYWPLPWYLRGYSRVGYWTVPPPVPDAPIIITDPRTAQAIFPTLQGAYTSSIYSLRPNVLLVVLVRQELWDAFMADRQ